MSDEATGWFEPLYTAARDGEREIPWNRGTAHPLLVDWAAARGLRGEGRRALVVGAGTGYSAAVLSAMGLHVVALESDAELAASARKQKIKIVEGPLDQGHAAGAPYDHILIDGAVGYIPDALVDQLDDGGRLGAALIDRGVTRLAVGRKAGNAFGTLSVGDAGVPALPGFQRPRAFTF